MQETDILVNTVKSDDFNVIRLFLVYLIFRNVSGEVNVEGDRILLARGGRGGVPDNSFQGQKGQAHNVTLDLKLIADIGLVGLVEFIVKLIVIC